MKLPDYLERSNSAWGRKFVANRNRLGLDTAEKLIYIKANHMEEQTPEDKEDQQLYEW